GWPYSFGTYADGSPILPRDRRAFRQLAWPNRRAISNPFAEHAVLKQLGAYESTDRTLAENQRLQQRCAELERQLRTLPHSLFGYAGSAMETLLPGSKDRVYHLLQATSQGYGRLRQLRRVGDRRCR